MLLRDSPCFLIGWSGGRFGTGSIQFEMEQNMGSSLFQYEDLEGNISYGAMEQSDGIQREQTQYKKMNSAIEGILVYKK